VVDGPLHFHGVVKDDQDMPVEGATVTLFACYGGGVEKSLASACSGPEGAYVISVPKPPEFDKLAGFRVRAVKARPDAQTSGSRDPGRVHLTKNQSNAENRSRVNEVKGWSGPESPGRDRNSSVPGPPAPVGERPGSTPPNPGPPAGRPGAAPRRRRPALVAGGGGRLSRPNLTRR